MKKLYLENGLKVLYEYRNTKLTSFCIAIDGGAVREGEKLGLAHAVEHMVFKGTSTKNELEINTLCDRHLGFNNAMTNFPYVIYYGTALNEELEKGLEVYSDILINPAFKEEGFQEEINVILEELQEWSEDNDQHCEDLLYKNAFSKRRIRELIIGNEAMVKSITLGDITEFYKEFYLPNNAAIAFVTSLSEEEILHLSKKYFKNWNKRPVTSHKPNYESNKPGIYVENRAFKGGKIQYTFPIDSLTSREIKALRLFNNYFGEGTSSELYHNIRTVNGLAYDLSTKIAFERDIKRYNIYVSTSAENIQRVMEIIDNLIKKTKMEFNLDRESLLYIAKAIKIKRELFIEKSIQLAKELSTYEIIFGDGESFYEEVEGLEEITVDEIKAVINKVLVSPSVQILKGQS